MNRKDMLALLRAHSHDFAKTYVEIKEALMREGVPAKEAADSARLVATLAVTEDIDDIHLP